MRQNGKMEALLERHRGVWLMLLCVLLAAAGSARFGGRTAQTSSRAGERELPIYCVDTQKPQVALSFDAAWGNEDTQKILDILEKRGVHVTFFMTGGWVSSYPEDVKKIFAAGHDLGNHSENHKNMSQLSKEDCTRSLTS